MAKKEDEDRPLSRWAAKKEPEKPQAKPAPPPQPRPIQKVEPPRPPNPFEVARNAMTYYLDTSGDLNVGQFADAVRKLPKADLTYFQASIPIGTGRTAVKCQRLREVVTGVINEGKNP